MQVFQGKLYEGEQVILDPAEGMVEKVQSGGSLQYRGVLSIPAATAARLTGRASENIRLDTGERLNTMITIGNGRGDSTGGNWRVEFLSNGIPFSQ